MVFATSSWLSTFFQASAISVLKSSAKLLRSPGDHTTVWGPFSTARWPRPPGFDCASVCWPWRAFSSEASPWPSASSLILPCPDPLGLGLVCSESFNLPAFGAGGNNILANSSTMAFAPAFTRKSLPVISSGSPSSEEASSSFSSSSSLGMLLIWTCLAAVALATGMKKARDPPACRPRGVCSSFCSPVKPTVGRVAVLGLPTCEEGPSGSSEKSTLSASDEFSASSEVASLLDWLSLEGRRSLYLSDTLPPISIVTTPSPLGATVGRTAGLLSARDEAGPGL
mmetsp:Transcript_71710/g.127212  ORF Transcript_71710/g.127212 Transcript_71710/m.127212 type:complete len:283 (+) Transcript_71710:374-1222(+)